MEGSVRLSRSAAQRTERAVLAFERDGGSTPGGGTRGGSWNRPPIRGILLEDLESDGTADVAVTVPNETTEVQQVSLLGEVLSTGTFKLKFKGKTTTSLKVSATAAEVQAALEKLETIGKQNVSVGLGKITAADGSTENPGVWLVTFQGVFAGVDVPLLESETTSLGLAILVAATRQWEDSGQVETVSGMVPVGSPTPMRAGAVILAIWFPNEGYGVVSCEPRYYTSVYVG